MKDIFSSHFIVLVPLLSHQLRNCAVYPFVLGSNPRELFRPVDDTTIGD